LLLLLAPLLLLLLPPLLLLLAPLLLLLLQAAPLRLSCPTENSYASCYMYEHAAGWAPGCV
jgi:hypothetical protein